jgi:TonB-dependent receptor
MLLNFYYENRSKCVYIVLLAFLLVFQSYATAQTGTIKGQVTDKTTKDALIGASVLVQGTNLGAAADIDGNFIIHNVSAGNQVLVISYVGYKNLNLNLNVEANKTTEIKIKLDAMAIEGKTVIVTAQAKGQLQAINQQLSSTNIVNVVSSEKMQELPDANIAESIGRLPGISLQRNAGEANAVIVRGLSPKYNEVTIEGIPMSSTNYVDRGVDLSLISDDLVRGVEVSKTLRPDMDADALGGTVNLTLKTAPTGLHYSAAGQGAYNNLRDTYNNYKLSATVSNRFLNDKVGALLLGSIEQKQLPSDQFNATYTTAVSGLTDPNNLYKVTTTQAQLTESNVNRHRFGLSLVLDYTSDFVDIKFFNVYDQKNDSTLSRDNITSFANTNFTDNINVNETITKQRTHSLQGLFKFGGIEVPVSIAYTKGEQNVPNGQQFVFLQTAGGNPVSAAQQIYGSPNSLIDIQGVMNPLGTNNNIAARDNTTLNNMLINNTKLSDESYDGKIDFKVPFKLSDVLSGKLSAGGKYHYVNRVSTNQQVYDYLLFGKGKGNRLDIGSYFFPTYNQQDFGNVSQAGPLAYPWVDPSYTRTNILGYNIGPGYNIYQLVNMQNQLYYHIYRDTSKYSVNPYFNSGPNDYNQNYTDIEQTKAGYLMGEFNIGNDLTIVAGVRYQEEQTDISAYHIQINSAQQSGLAGQSPQLIENKRDNPFWYPSLNVKYKANENIQLVGAVYKSVSLPDFNQITPLIIYDPSNKVIAAGNPLLKPSTAWNVDLGVSLFNNNIGLFTVNVFYKDISNLIYGMQNYYPFAPFPYRGVPSDLSSRLPGKSYFDTVWAKANSALQFTSAMPMNNPSDAFLRGIELSWQTHLWYLPGVLNGIVLDLNASWMSSNQMYPGFKIVGPTVGNKDTLVYAEVKGPLQDQPKAIYNAILGWDFMGFSSRFSVRYQQSTVAGIDTRYNVQNTFTDDILLVDISLRQQIIENCSIFANATNINGHIDRTYFAHPSFSPNTAITYPAGQLPTGGQTYGWALQFGISYSY